MNRSFSTSSQAVYASVDISKAHIPEVNPSLPRKLRPYVSISDSAQEIAQKRTLPSAFMKKWNESVVDSIDFARERRHCDEKDCADALNCAI